MSWALKNLVSKSTISSIWAAVGGTGDWACPRVAEIAWVRRLGSRPSHITLVGLPFSLSLGTLNRRLAEMIGRRYMERICSPEMGSLLKVGSLLQPGGSLTTLTVKSAFAGTLIGIRIRPLVRMSEWAARSDLPPRPRKPPASEPAVYWAGTALGQLAPSTGANRGSLRLARNRAWMLVRARPMPLGGLWQVTQARPFAEVPVLIFTRSWKNALLAVIVWPGLLWLPSQPCGLGKTSFCRMTLGTPPWLQTLAGSGASSIDR